MRTLSYLVCSYRLTLSHRDPVLSGTVVSILCVRPLRPNPGHRLARRGPDYISRSLRPRALPTPSRNAEHLELTTTTTPRPTASSRLSRSPSSAHRAGSTTSRCSTFRGVSTRVSLRRSEHAAVALMWSGSGVGLGKIAKDCKIKKKVPMLGNAFDDGMSAQSFDHCVRLILYFSILL